MQTLQLKHPYQHAYYLLNKDRKSQYNKEYAQTLRGRYRIYLAQAKDRKLDMSLTFEEFTQIVSMPCSYCGEREKTRGIDRKDNSIGYLKSNSFSCCKVCNYMKKDISYIEFMSHVARICSHKVQSAVNNYNYE